MFVSLARRFGPALVLLCLSAPLSAGRIGGRILDGSGNPVSGVRVAWTPYRNEAELEVEATSGTAAPALGEVRTQNDGRFSIAVSPSGPPVSLRVEPSGLPGALLAGPFFPGSNVELPDIELPQSAALTGVVATTTGAPVSGARIFVASEQPSFVDVVFFSEATTGPDGSFADSSAPSGRRSLVVRSPGLVTFRQLAPVGAAHERIVLEPGGTLAGAVTDVAGRAAPGAIVSSTGVAVRTDASGRYRLVGVAPGLQPVEAVSGPDLMIRRGGVTVRNGAEVALDLRLAPAASVVGTVVDEASRRPIPAAQVIVFESAERGPGVRRAASALTDASGRFQAAPLPPGRWTVRATRTGYLASALRGIAASAASAGKAALALTPAASVAGRVVDEKGNPVAGARVHLSRRAGGGPRPWRGGGGSAVAAATVTGPDGRFRLDSLEAMTGATLEAAKAGLVPDEHVGFSLRTGQALGNQVLTLRMGLSARGRVSDEQGRPIAGTEIRVARADEGAGRRFWRAAPAEGPPDATSGTDGAFVVAGLREGLYRVTASRDGFAPKTAPSLPVAAKTATVWPPIVLSKGVALAGIVKDDRGTPVAGALVDLFGEDIEARNASTDASGAFRVDGLSSGKPAMIAVTAQGFAPARRAATPPVEGLLIALSRTGTIRGRVADADSSEPISDFAVGLALRPAGAGRGFGGGGPQGVAGPAQSVHAEDGSFELAGVGPGSWTVHVTAAGYRPADVSGVEVSAAEVKEGVEILLRRGGSLTGRVITAAGGGPVANASVSFAAGGSALAGAGQSPAATTDADGRFALDGLPAGRTTIIATHPDYVAASKDVDPSATSDVVISLGSGGEISGAVVASGGGPVAGASVRLAGEGDTGGAGTQTVQADSGGLFRFDHLAAGRYQLSAQSKSASSAPQEIVIADGQPMDGVQIPLSSGVQIDGSVSGLPAGKLGGVNVTATADGYRGTAVTGDDGKFTLQNAPTGVLRFNASTSFPLGRSTARTVEVPDDATELPVEIAFQGASRLSGQVSRSGKPIAGASVVATPDPPDGSGQRFSGMTDDTGRYDLEGLSDGTFAVSVNGQGVTYRRSFSVSGDTNGDVALPGLTLSGSVTDSSTGAPVDGATVQAETGQESQSFAVKRAVTDSNGFYSITDLDPGSYQVTARKSGYELQTQPASLDAQPVTLDFLLNAGAGLRILVADGLTGMPLGGVSVLALGAGGTIAFQGPVTLDATGAGEVPSLAPGQYYLSIFSPAYAARTLPNVTVPSDPLAVSMTPGGRVEARSSAAVSGRIADASGATVLLSPFRLDGTVTVAAPVTVWEHVAPGSYTFLLQSSDGEKPYPFTVSEGKATGLTLP